MHRQKAYVVFRRRTSSGSEHFNNRSANKLFAWSESKAMIKLFQLQRSSEKYLIRQILLDDIDEIGSRRTTDDLQLDIVNLKSNRLERMVPFVTTVEEKTKFEEDIRHLFAAACNLGNSINDRSDIDIGLLILGIASLKPKYAAALELIGYRNAEINSVFDSVDDDESSWSEYNHTTAGYGCTIGQIIIYSLESVIKVLIDEM